MTQIIPVTQTEMKRRTGVDALGYTYPKKDTILIRKELTGEAKREVLDHELDHLEKGEEGPFWGAIIGGILAGLGAAAGGAAQASGYGKAADVERERLEEEKRRYEELAPFRQARLGALQDIQGIESGNVDVQALLERDPGYRFRLQEGKKGFERRLAARGGRLGGRAIKESMRYGQVFGSQEFGSLMNRKYRLAGMSGQQTPVPTSNLSQIYAGAGGAQAQTYANLSNVAQQSLQNYQTYKTYQDYQNQAEWQKLGGDFYSG